MRLLPLALLAVTAAAQTSDLYFVVFLRPDPSRTTLAKEESEKIQKAHMANIGKMAADGVLVAAGPFDDPAHSISGVFVMKATSLEEAHSIAANDPTVTSHRNTVDVHAWRGPAGIGVEYFKLHREHPETPENMGLHPFAIVTRGASWDPSQGRAHGEYIGRLKEAGKLSAAGPAESDGDIMGFVVFRRIPLEEAEALLKDDPAVRSGALRVQFYKWYSAEHVLPW
jgi:uncharacterized protein YciI